MSVEGELWGTVVCGRGWLWHVVIGYGAVCGCVVYVNVLWGGITVVDIDVGGEETEHGVRSKAAAAHPEQQVVRVVPPDRLGHHVEVLLGEDEDEGLAVARELRRVHPRRPAGIARALALPAVGGRADAVGQGVEAGSAAAPRAVEPLDVVVVSRLDKADRRRPAWRALGKHGRIQPVAQVHLGPRHLLLKVPAPVHTFIAGSLGGTKSRWQLVCG